MKRWKMLLSEVTVKLNMPGLISNINKWLDCHEAFIYKFLLKDTGNYVKLLVFWTLSIV
jgi:hypothetical protein